MALSFDLLLKPDANPKVVTAAMARFVHAAHTTSLGATRHYALPHPIVLPSAG
jgi:hypothetical protein